ncbi:MAG: TcfC E-set like domain-containing protein [Pseudomonadota bacterium]
MRSCWPAAIAALVFHSPVGADTLFEPTGEAPPGFEDLDGPQTTFVDVRFDGVLILSTEATYTASSLRFTQPQTVAQALPDVTDTALVTAALSGDLDTHAEAVCRHPSQTDCGRLTPDVAAVLFDEYRYEVHVFVHPDLRVRHALDVARYLPPPTSTSLSTLHQFNVALSDAGFDLGGTSMLARGANRLVGRYESSDGQLGLSELLWQRDGRGRRLEAGLYRTIGRNALFVGEQNIAGIRIGTALDLRADLDTQIGTPIFLFLDQRSRVDVFRGSRLLDSGFYDPGNRQLDTSALPDGAYEVTVRITGDDGRQREERFFFVRSGQIPPPGETVRFSEIGRSIGAPNAVSGNLDSGLWGRAGLAHRISNAWALDAEAIYADKDWLAQAGILGFGRHWQLRASALASVAGSNGYWLQYRTGGARWSASIDLRAINPPAGTASQLFPEPVRQSALTINAPLGRGRLTLRGQRDQDTDNAGTFSFGGSVSLPIVQRGDFFAEFETDVLRAQNDLAVRLSVIGRWRRGGRFTTVRAGGQSRIGGGGAPILDARRSSQKQSERFGQVGHALLARMDGDQSSVGASVWSDAERGRGRVDLQWLDGADRRGLSYSANARFGVTTDRGDISLGGRQANGAAVVIEVDGAPTDRFDVIVDEQRVASARGGTRTLVSLPPYARYGVRVAPGATTMLDVDDAPRSVVLYPGNVSTLHFDARRIYVLVGQARKPDGNTLANARIDLPGPPAHTYDDGWFQVEVNGLTPLRLTAADGRVCKIDLSEASPDEALTVLADATCVPYSGETVTSSDPE